MDGNKYCKHVSEGSNGGESNITTSVQDGGDDDEPNTTSVQGEEEEDNEPNNTTSAQEEEEEEDNEPNNTTSAQEEEEEEEYDEPTEQFTGSMNIEHFSGRNVANKVLNLNMLLKKFIICLLVLYCFTS